MNAQTVTQSDIAKTVDLSAGLSCAYKVVKEHSDASAAMNLASVGEIFEVPGLTGLKTYVKTNTSALVPEPTPGYVFDMQRLLTVLMVSGMLQITRDGVLPKVEYRAIVATGPTGSGKTSLFKEIAARLGVDVYFQSCTEDMEEGDLKGAFQLALPVDSDGNIAGTTPVMQWIDAPLLQAMRFGGWAILDEINLLHKGVVGFLNHVLETGTFQIHQTREVVKVHPDFRVFASGNAIDGENASSYPGAKRMNIALLDRFMKMKVGYLTDTQIESSFFDLLKRDVQPEGVVEDAINSEGILAEVEIIQKSYPKLPGEMVAEMVETAIQLRQSFRQGDLPAPLSTRGLRGWASLIITAPRKRFDKEKGKMVPVTWGEVMFDTLKLTYLNLLSSDELDAATQFLATRWASIGQRDLEIQ